MTASANFDPFQLCLKGAQAYWGETVSSQFELYSPDHPALRENLSGLEISVEGDPRLAIGRLKLELLAPELLTAKGRLAGEVGLRHEVLVSTLPAVDVDLGDAGRVCGRGATIVDRAFARHVIPP